MCGGFSSTLRQPVIATRAAICIHQSASVVACRQISTSAVTLARPNIAYVNEPMVTLRPQATRPALMLDELLNRLQAHNHDADISPALYNSLAIQ